MATLVWLNRRDSASLNDYQFANISPNKPYRLDCGDRAVIAKGNVIEGIRAKW